MKYETMKSFILFVLVGVSVLLTFLLWSYQPNYDPLNDADYVSEADVGGEEKSKNDLFEPAKIVFKGQEQVQGFKDPEQMHHFFKEISSWVLYDYEMTEASWKPGDQRYLEIIFPNVMPAELLPSLLTFDEDVEGANWSFDRIYMALNEEDQSVDVIIKSTDERRQIRARIDKKETYQEILNYMIQDNNALVEYMDFETEHTDIYIPKESLQLPRKTVIATEINSDLFINALFRNPSLVTPNVGEAYFTDGQRGMEIGSDNLSLEYINPIQSNYERLSSMELVEKSMENINEHKGWTNSFNFDAVNRVTNNIRYRMTYDNYPVFDDRKLSVIEQEWRNEELYNYLRPLVEVGNVLNTNQVDLISGEELIRLIKENKGSFKIENIRDIRLGYQLKMLEDNRSLTLEPNWFILYENDWVRFDADEYSETPEEG